ncbi:MAG: T9SS type A sorting domain-containing protein [Saprospiraceae bacterium]
MKTFFNILFLFSIAAFSQDPFVSVNQDLRDMFTDLDKPIPEREFLYEMAAHYVDESFFTNYSTDISNADNWFMLYDEMYFSAYDTSSLETTDEVFLRGNSFSQDTIPIVIMDFDYYTFKDDALSTNIYFDFDTINDQIHDKYPRPDFPYDIENLFAGSPSRSRLNFTENTFRVDPDFILADNFNSDYYSRDYQLKIDFGDNNGWVEFDPTVVTHHDVVYPDSGNYVMLIAIFVDNTPTKLSTVSLRVASGDQLVQPSETISQDGIRAGIYRGCNNEGLNKVIIYLEGIDIMDFIPAWNRDVAQIYNEQIKGEGFADLLNYGYDFVVVDWKNSRKSMVKNADHLIKFLDYLKCEIGNDHQFIIIGESMGGTIANFALTKMEVAENEELRCETKQLHNTRLLITLDSPHQGANIPLSLQHLYKDALDGFTILSRLDPLMGVRRKMIFKFYDLFLEGDAAKELLIYHYSTKDQLSNPSNYAEYSAHNSRDQFLNLLSVYGGRPSFCKVVALSNGSLRGRRQTRPYDGSLRQANDYLLKFDGSIYARILGIKLKLYGNKFHLQTNPNGNGQVYKREAGTWGIKLKVYWFGIKVKVGLISSSYENEYVNTDPICVNAGGIFDTGIQPKGASFDAGFDAFIMEVSSTNNGNGLYEFHTSIGIPWLLNSNVDFSIYSDGFHFNFIPVKSALNISSPFWNQDFETMNINTKLSLTPFDIIAGIPESAAFNVTNNLRRNMNRFNRQHLNLENNVIATTDFDPDFFGNHMSCPIYSDDNLPNFVRILNREIGDDILWLENMNLNRVALFESEYDIHVNVRNPYYEYPSQPNPNLASDFMEDGFYSKEGIFNILNSGEATFKYDEVNSPTGIGLDYQAPLTGIYNELNAPLFICCLNYNENYYRLKGKISPLKTNELFIFPNPSNNKEVTVKLKFSEGKDVNLKMFDFQGRVIFEKIIPYDKDHLEKRVDINLSPFQLQSGAYIIIGTNSGGQAYQKLIIQNQ